MIFVSCFLEFRGNKIDHKEKYEVSRTKKIELIRSLVLFLIEIKSIKTIKLKTIKLKNVAN